MRKTQYARSRPQRHWPSLRDDLIPCNAAVLGGHRKRQNEERLRAPGDAWKNHDLVFPNRIGKPLDHNNLYYREYKPLLKRAGLEGFTFHTLRHTFATALFSRGEHPKRVQSLLGHSSITQTMDTYSHLIDDIGGDAVDGLDEAFGDWACLAVIL